MISGLIALVCLVLLAVIIPNEVWGCLGYLALVGILLFVGFWSTMFFIAEVL